MDCYIYIASLLIAVNEVPESNVFHNACEPPNSLLAAEVLDNSAKPLGLTYVVPNPKYVTRPLGNLTFTGSKLHCVAVVKYLHSSLLFSRFSTSD